MSKTNIEWVDDTEVNKISRGKPVHYDATPVIEQLYANPMRWAKLPVQFKHSAQVLRLKKAFKGIEVKSTGGNNLATTHPDKRLWTVYVRYNPDKEQ
jgi:hypothetical protein